MKGELGVTELGRRLGVHKATASRLVSTLGDHGLVERNPATEKFRLGLGLMYLAGAAIAGVDLVQHARSILEDLAERCQETVTLGVFDRDQVVYVDQIASTRAIVSVNWVGRRTPLHCSASGKVLLACQVRGRPRTPARRQRSNSEHRRRSPTRTSCGDS